MPDETKGELKVIEAVIHREIKKVGAVYVTILFEDEEGQRFEHQVSFFRFDLKKGKPKQ